MINKLLKYLSLSCVGWALTVSGAEKPSIIVIVADNLGDANVERYGCPDIPIPHIDKLAAEGVRFTSGNLCGPSRAGFLTGVFGQHSVIAGTFLSLSIRNSS